MRIKAILDMNLSGLFSAIFQNKALLFVAEYFVFVLKFFEEVHSWNRDKLCL